MDNTPQPTISELVPGFIEYLSVERRFSPATVKKYHDNVNWFRRDVGDMAVTEIRLEHFISLKARMAARGARAARRSVAETSGNADAQAASSAR